MIIRPFETGDQAAVVDLWNRCGLIVPWNDPARDIDRTLQVQPELFVVGVRESKLIASAMGGYDGHRGWIYYLAVDPEHRGRGYGSRLIEHLSAELRTLGCPKLNIMVRTSNREVIQFYQKLGFKGDEVVCLGKRLITD